MTCLLPNSSSMKSSTLSTNKLRRERQCTLLGVMLEQQQTILRCRLHRTPHLEALNIILQCLTGHKMCQQAQRNKRR
jgi:hypothetical protein